MKTEISRTIEVPQGIEVSIEDSLVTVKGPKGELKKELGYPTITLKKEDGTIKIESKEATQKEKAIIGTFEAHLNNMFTGVTSGFTYRMKVLYSHFPMTLKQVDKDIEIHNFFGEKSPRKSRVVGNVTVKLEKDEVVIEGINKEEVSQTAANLWTSTKVKRKDSRVFQDGIYLIEKGVAEEKKEVKPNA